VNAKTNDGWTALMMAAVNGHIFAVDILLSKGADVNARDNKGMTAQGYASCNKMYPSENNVYRKIIELLEEAGAKE
jgi:hypothetical protein